MSAAMKLDAERAAFEDAAKRINECCDFDFQRLPHGPYADTATDCAWLVWLASRTPPQGELSALPELPPVPDHPYGQGSTWLNCEMEAIRDYARAYGLLCRQSAPWNPTDKELVQMQEDARDAMLWRQSGDAADKRDAERLDFLGKYAVIAKPGQPIRDAIDAAIAQRQEGGNADQT